MAAVALPVQPNPSINLDTYSVTTTAGTVLREGVVIGDGTTGAAVAEVVNVTPALTDYGLATRNIPSNSATSGTLSSVVAAAAVNCDGMSTVFIQCTVTGTNTTTPQFSMDGTNWVTAAIYPLSANGIPTGASVITITATGKWAVPVGMWKQFRLNMTAFTSNQNVYLYEASAAQVFTVAIQPTAANLNVTLSTNTVTATQGAAAAATVTAPWGATPTQGTTLLTTTATSAATTQQTLTATGAASTRVIVRGIYLYGTALATCTLVLQDGGVTKIDFGTVTLTAEAKAYGIGVPIYTGATAANVTLVVGAASAGTTTASLVADRE